MEEDDDDNDDDENDDLNKMIKGESGIERLEIDLEAHFVDNMTSKHRYLGLFSG